jgi:ABC-type phosphate transport system substrate-binding protein
MVVAVAAVLAGCGCGNGTTNNTEAIRETIYGFVEAYNARDYQQCLSYFTGWDGSSTEEAQLSLLEMARGFTGEMTVEKIEDITISGSTATAVVTSSWEYPDEEGKTTNAPGEEIRLKKEGSKWKYVV